jgi:hypothetical protein
MTVKASARRAPEAEAAHRGGDSKPATISSKVGRVLATCPAPVLVHVPCHPFDCYQEAVVCRISTRVDVSRMHLTRCVHKRSEILESRMIPLDEAVAAIYTPMFNRLSWRTNLASGDKRRSLTVRLQHSRRDPLSKSPLVLEQLIRLVYLGPTISRDVRLD